MKLKFFVPARIGGQIFFSGNVDVNSCELKWTIIKGKSKKNQKKGISS